MKDFASADVTRMYREEYAQALNSLGRFNLAIFGKTGTGKSTLVNAIFGQDVAATGTGRPVTTGLDYYVHPNGILGVYDSRGFETGEAGDRILKALEDIVSASRGGEASAQIHAAWYTVRWSDRRFEEHQGAFVRRLHDLGLPVLFVLTQVPCNTQGQIHEEALEFARYVAAQGLPLAGEGRVFLTNAKADPFLGTVVFGLQELLDATFDTIPEVAVAALSAAQQLDWGRKRQAAKRIIATSASSALATGATPDSVFRRGHPGPATDRDDRAADGRLRDHTAVGATGVVGRFTDAVQRCHHRGSVDGLIAVARGSRRSTGRDGDLGHCGSQYDHGDGMGVGVRAGEVPCARRPQR